MDLHPPLTPLLVLLLLTSCTTSPYLVKSRPHNNFTDHTSLLHFKSHVDDPLGILASNWTTNTSFCSWTGITCSRRRQRVAALDLHNTPLQGSISPHLANLSFLSFLNLGNTTLTGPIPNTLSHLPRLRTLDLRGNYLSGPIPSGLFNMSSLVEIDLGHNNLSGSIPASNHSLRMHYPRLQIVALEANVLTGRIPSSIAHCLDLQVLSLHHNKLSGTVPADLGYLLQLRVLYLLANQLTGNIPSSIGNLTQLQELYISQNNLEGEIPKELGNLLNLQYLVLGSCGLTGSIPVALLNDSKIVFLELVYNNLTGSVPPTLGESMPLLYHLNIAANSLSGSLNFITSLSNCRNLQLVEISLNEVDGSLSNSVGNLSENLQYFTIADNHVRGNIPSGFGNLTGLLLLDLGGNDLIGSIPPAITRLQRLQQLYLRDNSINGSILPELGLMTSLELLYLRGNELSGLIPDSLNNLTGLQYLELDTNKLSSKIPQSLWSLRSLIELGMSQNTLSGSIPLDVGNLKMLDTLDLSMNQLSGNLSSALGQLQMLTYLDLSSNFFHGQIPTSLGGLINVKRLNFSKNLLSGPIPNSLANLLYLESLDLSFNKLEGQIPQGKAFSNLSIPSLEGNSALCGAPQLDFPPCSNIVSSQSRRALHLLKYILPIIALVVVALSCIFLFFYRRKVRTLAGTISPRLGEHRAVSYHDLVRATNSFSQDNLLGKGRDGSVFKGCLDDGFIVAVKVLNLEVEGASKSFDAECQALCSARHRNLIKIISVCSNFDFKALILPFMPSGSLEQWLHSENCHLNLLQRLNIMIDVSSALEYLHHYHSQIVLHCDLKPSNVLLDEDLVAHVSDFGVAKLLLDNNRSVTSASTAGTIGYIAPEYGSTGRVSTLGDVYSFGILLLETFTGKKPTNAMFNEESSLTECVRKAYPDALLDIVDHSLLKDGSLTEQRSGEQTAMHRCLSSIIELGLLCSSYSPKERIPMIEVVPKLQKIKAEY